MNTFSKYKLQHQIGMVLTYAGLVVALIFFLFPFVWILTTSLKGNEDYFTFPPVWIPTEPSLVHYYRLVHPWQWLAVFQEQPGHFEPEHAGGAALQRAHGLQHRALSLRRLAVFEFPPAAADHAGDRPGHPHLRAV